MNKRYKSDSTEATIEFANRLASEVNCKLLLLEGSMGAGKTQFVKGFAQGLGIRQHVSSPTYTLVNEYKGEKINLVHMDLYRIESLEEVADLGLYEVLDSQDYCLIEWGDKLDELKKLNHIKIVITSVAEPEQQRFITVKTHEVNK